MTGSDLDFMAGLLGDERVMRYYPRPRSRQEAMEWIEWSRRMYHSRGFGLWIIERLDEHQVIGDCGLTPQLVDGAEEVELGFHVHPDHQGQGYATEAAAAVLGHARSALGLDRIVAIIDPRNEPSKRVVTKLGFRREKAVSWNGKRVELFVAG